MNLPFSKCIQILLVYLGIGIFAIIFTKITGQSICIFYDITGVPCPSCGMTRAGLRILHGDFFGSLQYHPLFLTILIIPLSFLSKNMTDKKRTILFSSLVVLFVLVWFVRLGRYFPHTEPFLFNDQAVIPRIIRFFQHI